MFTAPIKDMLFNIEHISGWSDLVALPANSALELDDAAAVLEEFGRFCTDVIAPLNASGDKVGARYDNGRVAREAFEAVVAHIVNTAKDRPNAAYGGAVPYLLLAGNLMSGWQMARSLLAAETALLSGLDAEFMTARTASARFYADHILCDVESQSSRIMEGSDSLLSMAI